MAALNNLQQEALNLLEREQTSYAKPLNSEIIGRMLNVTPSYIRSQLAKLAAARLIGVRRGNSGGYYILKGGLA